MFIGTEPFGENVDGPPSGRAVFSQRSRLFTSLTKERKKEAKKERKSCGYIDFNSKTQKSFPTLP